MKNLISDIAEHIKTECGYKVNVGQFPDSPNNLVLLNWKSGVKPYYSFDKPNAYRRRPFLMVEVRNESYFDALEVIENVNMELERLYGNLGDKYILNITKTSEPLENGRDKKNNYNFLQNYIVDFKED